MVTFSTFHFSFGSFRVFRFLIIFILNKFEIAFKTLKRYD